jgi:hypothetical protein
MCGFSKVALEQGLYSLTNAVVLEIDVVERLLDVEEKLL